MWTLSGFADEISPDLNEQCEVATGLGLKFIEVRSAWDVNILDLSPDQLATMRKTLSTYGLKVSSIGSPIGEIFIDEDFAPPLNRMPHPPEWPNNRTAPSTRISPFFLGPAPTRPTI